MGWDLEISAGKCEGGDLQVQVHWGSPFNIQDIGGCRGVSEGPGVGAREDPVTSLSPELWRAPILGHEARSKAAKMQNEEENPGSVVLNLGRGQC